MGGRRIDPRQFRPGQMLEQSASWSCASGPLVLNGVACHDLHEPDRLDNQVEQICPNREDHRTALDSLVFLQSLGLQKVKMMRRAGSVTDCQTMANGFGEVGLGRLHGIVHGFASCEMGCDGRGERAAGAMRVRGIDEFSLEHVEIPAVIEQIGGSLSR